MKPSRNRGFTLIEILVVLVITGFIVTILMQSLYQVFRLQTQFGSEIFETQRGAMYTDWFRQSIDGLMPDSVEGKHKFRGEERKMTGLTLFPLTRDSGAPVPFAWRLEFDMRSNQTSLYFDEEGQAPGIVPILAWPGNDVRFSYIDADNVAHDSWPPFLGLWPQMPTAVYLEGGTAERSQLIVAVPQGPRIPLPRRADIEAL